MPFGVSPNFLVLLVPPVQPGLCDWPPQQHWMWCFVRELCENYLRQCNGSSESGSFRSILMNIAAEISGCRGQTVIHVQC